MQKINEESVVCCLIDFLVETLKYYEIIKTQVFIFAVHTNQVIIENI